MLFGNPHGWAFLAFVLLVAFFFFMVFRMIWYPVDSVARSPIGVIGILLAFLLIGVGAFYVGGSPYFHLHQKSFWGENLGGPSALPSNPNPDDFVWKNGTLKVPAPIAEPKGTELMVCFDNGATVVVHNFKAPTKDGEPTLVPVGTTSIRAYYQNFEKNMTSKAVTIFEKRDPVKAEPKADVKVEPKLPPKAEPKKDAP